MTVWQESPTAGLGRLIITVPYKPLLILTGKLRSQTGCLFMPDLKLLETQALDLSASAHAFLGD